MRHYATLRRLIESETNDPPDEAEQALRSAYKDARWIVLASNRSYPLRTLYIPVPGGEIQDLKQLENSIVLGSDVYLPVAYCEL